MLMAGNPITSHLERVNTLHRQLTATYVHLRGLAAVEGRSRAVNEEITINRFTDLLPQSSHGPVLIPTIIPVLLTRPISSQT